MINHNMKEDLKAVFLLYQLMIIHNLADQVLQKVQIKLNQNHFPINIV